MAKKKQSAAVKILFIGNSFTQRNDLPGLVAAMAAEREVRIRHKLISAGGASLRNALECRPGGQGNRYREL